MLHLYQFINICYFTYPIISQPAYDFILAKEVLTYRTALDCSFFFSNPTSVKNRILEEFRCLWIRAKKQLEKVWYFQV